MAETSDRPATDAVDDVLAGDRVGGPVPGAAADPLVSEPADPGRPRRRRRTMSGKFVAGLVILGLFVLMAAIGPLVAPYDPSNLGPDVLAPPSWQHWLGTTGTGQDVLSQLLVGARQTLIIGVLAGLIATAISTIIGVTGGFVGGIADDLLSLLSNVFLVVPALPLLIVLTGYLPNGGPVAVAAVISLTGWAWGSRVLRAQTLSIRRRDYIEAARVAGEPGWRIIVFEILPHVRAILASSFLFTVLFAILTQVGLAFLGLVDVSQWSWGVMLYWAQSADALNAGAWWWFVPPGLAVALIGTGLALLNFGVDEFINPRLRSNSLRGRAARDSAGGFTPVVRTDPQPSEVQR
ncbi:ABC transporter permease [Nakamurella endophytica]|uniref:Peptide ABC transporter permease n=1 Tax=Nakamurella endophytica TaxID=1748367 RepID=A0A917SSD2_9ACTN|nr:ABC transporter permease [Nakamurella endophytica]GGL94458.1 peptide ABC transporter permease [Nakamurella endophytica]